MYESLMNFFEKTAIFNDQILLIECSPTYVIAYLMSELLDLI